jgi:signal transduction histidine kinase
VQPDHAHPHDIEDRTFSLVLQQAPIAVWATDRALRLTYAHTRVSVLSEAAAHQAVGKTVQQLLGLEDASAPPVTHHLAALAGEPQSFRYWFRSRTFDVRIDPLTNDRGEISGCIGVALDVTEQEQLERKFLMTRQRFEEAQAVAHIGTFEWEVSRDRMSWSDEMHLIYGVTKDGFSGTFEAFLSYVHPGDRTMVEHVIVESLAHAQPFESRHRIVRPDGDVRTLLTRGDIVGGDESDTIRVIGCCWDATALAETTRHLERSVSLLEATLNATADGLLVVDLDGRVVTYNERFVTLWRIPPPLAERRDDAALLAFVLDQLEDPEAFLQGVRVLYGKPEATSFDTLLFKDGRVLERYSAAQRLGAEIIGRVWSFRDVTEREHAHRQANESIGILAIAAHDVRNPLGGLQLQLDLMKRGLQRDCPPPDVLNAQIATCNRFVARCSALLTSLLDVARIGAEKLKLQREMLDLSELTREVVTRSRVEIEAARCELTLRADTPVMGSWDRDRLDQVITNLLSNALKYGRGEPVEISVSRDGVTAFVVVKDHGIGISVADRERVFNQFERAVAPGRGVGLGLWIVRKLVAALGGRVDVASTIGEGSTFTLALPVDQVDQVEVRHASSADRR